MVGFRAASIAISAMTRSTGLQVLIISKAAMVKIQFAAALAMIAFLASKARIQFAATMAMMRFMATKTQT